MLPAAGLGDCPFRVDPLWCSIEFLCVFLCVLCAFARSKESRAKAQRTQRNTQRFDNSTPAPWWSGRPFRRSFTWKEQFVAIGIGDPDHVVAPPGLLGRHRALHDLPAKLSEPIGRQLDKQ